jgi:predicted DNA-binding transcriptional regulator AlpA
MQTDDQTYLPAAGVRKRYGVSDMSLWRWLNNEALGFPHPIRINKRRFWRLDDLRAWEALQSVNNGGADERTA